MTTKVRQSTLVSVANTQIVGTVASANTVTTPSFTIQESGGKLVIKYGSSTIVSIDSTGNIVSANNITAGGTP
jgi:tryptophan synthase beta subunit